MRGRKMRERAKLSTRELAGMVGVNQAHELIRLQTIEALRRTLD